MPRAAGKRGELIGRNSRSTERPSALLLSTMQFECSCRDEVGNVNTLADDGTLDSQFVRGVATMLLNASVATLVAAWSWFWTTWPVNDNMASHWSDSDWTNAALHNVAMTGLRAALMFVVLLGSTVACSGRLSRDHGSPFFWLSRPHYP